MAASVFICFTLLPSSLSDSLLLLLLLLLFDLLGAFILLNFFSGTTTPEKHPISPSVHNLQTPCVSRRYSKAHVLVPAAGLTLAHIFGLQFPLTALLTQKQDGVTPSNAENTKAAAPCTVKAGLFVQQLRNTKEMQNSLCGHRDHSREEVKSRNR